MTQPKTLSRHLPLILLLWLSGILIGRAGDVSVTSKVDSLRHLIPTQNGAERLNSWMRLYYAVFTSGNDSLGMQVLDEWMADARKTKSAWSESVARQNKIIDLFNATKYEEAIEQAKRQMSFCDGNKKLTRKYFEAWHLLTCCFYSRGQYNTALRESRLMHEAAIRKSDIFGQAMSYYNIGTVYYAMRHFSQSVDAFQQSVALLQQEDSSVSVLLEVYPYYGDALEAKRDFKQLETVSHDWWERIQQINHVKQKLDLPSTLANYYVGRTQALMGLGRIEEARKMLEEVEKNVTDSLAFERLYMLYYKAKLALYDGHYDEALALNSERIALSRVIYDMPTLVPIHLQRAEILLAAGRYKEAAEMYRRTYELSDSLNTTQSQEQLNEMKTLFQVDELKMQNALQQNRYYRIIGSMLVVALLVFLLHRYIAARSLKKKNDELALRNAELKLAEEKAQEASRMKTAFIRNISHEIRTPLNILNGFSHVLIDQGEALTTQEKGDISQGIEDNSKRISELVNKLLEMSDTISLDVIERTDTITAAQIAEDAIRLSGISESTAPADAESPVRFIFSNEVDSGLQIVTHRLYAQRALRHLLENAFKFTSQGTITLRLTADEQCVYFTIEDTGIGIPLEARERIFGEFVKLDDYASGTGIGLPVARRVARKLGGDIVLDCQYSGGSRFILKLPKQ